MGRSLTQTQKDTIAAMLGTDTKQTAMAEAANCSVSTVKRIKRNIANWGTPTAPIFQRQGRPREITEEALEVRRLDIFYVFLQMLIFSGVETVS